MAYSGQDQHHANLSHHAKSAKSSAEQTSVKHVVRRSDVSDM